jgi:hypothetical protein
VDWEIGQKDNEGLARILWMLVSCFELRVLWSTYRTGVGGSFRSESESAVITSYTTKPEGVIVGAILGFWGIYPSILDTSYVEMRAI